MSVTHPDLLNIAVPGYGVDQIIGIKSGSFAVGAGVAGTPATAQQSYNTGFGDSCFFQGVFSTDGGASWNDFGTYQPNLTTPAQPVLQTVTCYGYVDSSGNFVASGISWYDLVHAVGTAYTIQYKVAFIAKPTQNAITPIATNETLYYNSKYNHQKIYLDSNFASTTGSTVVAHNLGYVPKVRAYFQPSSTANNADGISIPANAITTLDNYQYATNVYPDTANVTFTDVSTTVSPRTTRSGTMYYRIYLDS